MTAKRPSVTFEEIDQSLHDLLALHSKAPNGAACKVCLVADGYAHCITRTLLADITANLHYLRAKGSSPQ